MSTGHGTASTRSRGRPKNTDTHDVRTALLSAARELFLRYGYRAVSSRQIAAAAGANVAMIRYYFGGKAGLYREMLDGLLAPMRARIEQMLADPSSVDLGALLGLATRTHATNPWVGGLILREVLSADGPMRPMFLREIGGRMEPFLKRILQREIERGRLRRDLDPQLTMLSMISLAVFPFLAFQVTSRMFGVSRDEEYVERLVRHTGELLARGFGSQEKE
jgi:AcrR family transcriptional regulator